MTWSDAPNVIVSGAPVFVPRPGSRKEADGVLLVDGLGADGLSVFVVLSALTFLEIGRVTLPFRQTLSSAGSTWVWDENLFYIK